MKRNAAFIQILFSLGRLLGVVIACVMMAGCQQKSKVEMTPWGTPVGGEADTIPTGFTLSDIQANGELIMLTLNGPDTYYDYRGRGMGLQFLLCERFAQQLGVKLRVEVCQDTTELLSRLKAGEGDVIAVPLPQRYQQLDYCGYSSTDSLKQMWAVLKNNTELADTLNRWFRPELVAEVKAEESFLLSTKSVTRRVYSPMLNRSGGIISRYDALFQKYAPVARWDWRLLAAQCYQESTFDPQARSWAGACGLMQIMPATADHLGLARGSIYDPEQNIAAAVRYLGELEHSFSDIRERSERTKFVLAAYNGGGFHIRDAMALAEKNGRNPRLWRDVEPYVLGLSNPQYYNDPVVKSGYMRGSETVDYVRKIHERWNGYRGVKTLRPSSGPSGVPQKAKRERKKKFQI